MNQKPTNEIAAGFTLIEMAIVTALLLVLLAIAVPEFREAQTLSSVVQVKTDIHTLVVAQEAYYQDFGIYPAESESDAANFPRSLQGLFWLTSPIPYLEQVPVDPFGFTSMGVENPTYESGGIETSNIRFSNCLVTWEIASHGPDLNQSIWQDSPHYSRSGNPNLISYSPTNGTESGGDIFQYGGDPFWIGIASSAARRPVSPSLEVGLTVDGVFYLHRLPPPLK
ncbi:MAG: prepilin-type N-terminal cleavage/methylation domain-containing protein [Candidatus Omnitrophica bacterium]|nr:prepilin-type N-terminal cleavage/methylation domain-containing protein [Candidatus Omnitrophota bacterium]